MNSSIHYEILANLLHTYIFEREENKNEAITVDHIITTVFNNPEYSSDLGVEESVELQRDLWACINDSEYLRDNIELHNFFCLFISQIKGPFPRYIHKYTEAFINNITVPTSLEELEKIYSYGKNDAEKLLDLISNHKTIRWTTPRWAKQGDIVLFMHAKSSRGKLTKLRTETKKTNPSNEKLILGSIEEQLEFYKDYGGKIYAVGRVNGKPENEGTIPNSHFKANIRCDHSDLFKLDKPVDISEFRSFIKISPQGAITPVYGEPYEKLKRIIRSKNKISKYLYFAFSHSTPFPHSLVNEQNWKKLGLEYRFSFTLEAQFRQCYLDYLLKELGDQKTIYRECTCHKVGKNSTHVDNVIKIDGKFLPVEDKLNIKLEKKLKQQCESYCNLDSIELSQDRKRQTEMKDVIKDKVLIFDTYGVYMYFSENQMIETLFDLCDLKHNADVKRLREIIIRKMNQ